MKTNRTTATAIVSSILLTIGLAACSSDGSEGGEEEKATTTLVSTTVADDDPTDSTTPGIISPSLPSAPELTDATGIRSDATMADCSTDPGEVVASGSVTNTSEAATDILVSVSWVSGDSSDVVARAFAPLEDAGPGQAVEWRATAQLGDGYEEVTCVLNVRRGTLGG